MEKNNPRHTKGCKFRKNGTSVSDDRNADGEYILDYAVTATLKVILNAFGMTADNIHKQAREISSDLMRVEKEAIEAVAKMSETEGSVQQ